MVLCIVRRCTLISRVQTIISIPVPGQILKSPQHESQLRNSQHTSSTDTCEDGLCTHAKIYHSWVFCKKIDLLTMYCCNPRYRSSGRRQENHREYPSHAELIRKWRLHNEKASTHPTTCKQLLSPFELVILWLLTCSQPSIAMLVDSLEIRSTTDSGITECFIVSQPLIEDNLEKLIRSSSLSRSSRSSLLVQMLEGLAFIHNEKCMHRDIKPQNILISRSPLRAVIIDFGWAIWDRTSADHRKGTIRYLAPAIIALKEKTITSKTKQSPRRQSTIFLLMFGAWVQRHMSWCLLFRCALRGYQGRNMIRNSCQWSEPIRRSPGMIPKSGNLLWLRICFGGLRSHESPRIKHIGNVFVLHQPWNDANCRQESERSNRRRRRR